MTTVTVRTLPVMIVTDDGAGQSEYKPIPDDIYAIVKANLPLYCVDIVAINKHERLFYLAKRERQPRRGWWWFGGRIGKDELPKNAAIRKLHEELDINVETDRLQMIGIVLHYIKEEGSQGTFPVVQMAFEPTPNELASIRLEPKEYDAAAGVTAFNREGLVRERVNETVIAMYDAFFEK